MENVPVQTGWPDFDIILVISYQKARHSSKYHHSRICMDLIFISARTHQKHIEENVEFWLTQKHPVVLSCIPYLPEEISSPKASKRSILSAVGKIFGISDISSMNKELSLLELGMDSLIEVELKLLLDQDGSETPDSKVAVTYDIEEAHLGSNAQDNSWLIPKETIVHLNSVKSGIPLFVVHPIEGTVGMLYSLAQLITVLFGIQYTSEAPKIPLKKLLLGIGRAFKD
ncbi:fatty acid synthase [Trichonephila clavata]|uniref:Fatty acid synthase n=1 Tax=Trichonephila clavata TaxID=2740835 RepID=A0A8X6FZG7_TRICU|nr:fatty acid synthase [Trichonephila clavata]